VCVFSQRLVQLSTGYEFLVTLNLGVLIKERNDKVSGDLYTTPNSKVDDKTGK